jgi:hypothetical protein
MKHPDYGDVLGKANVFLSVTGLLRTTKKN